MPLFHAILTACRRLRAFSPRAAAFVARAVEVESDLRLHAFEALIGQEKPDGAETPAAFAFAYECGAGADRWDASRFLRKRGLGVEADAILAGDHLRAEEGGAVSSDALERRVDILVALGNLIPLGSSTAELRRHGATGDAAERDVAALLAAGLIVERDGQLHISDDAQDQAHDEGLRVFAARRFATPRTPEQAEAWTLADVEERARAEMAAFSASVRELRDAVRELIARRKGA